MRTTLSGRAEKILLIGAVSSLMTWSLHAQTYDVSETYTGINLAQGNSGITGSQSLLENACAPVATANGLSYLYSLDSSAFSSSPNNYTAVNNLISAMGTGTTGTTGANILSGLQSYLSPTGANPSPGITATQTSEPTGLNLNTALAANDAVQIGILWGTESGSGPTYTFTTSDGGGGHFVSVTGIDIVNGSGTMTVLDPWGSAGGNPGTTAATVTLSVSTYNFSGIGTVLYVNYGPGSTQPADNTSTDGTGSSSYGGFGGFSFPSGYIALEDIESVPEPSTIALMAGTGLAWLARRRWKK
jgi:hypothetical protein